MKNHKNNANTCNKIQMQDTKSKAQLVKVYNSLMVKPMTLKETSIYTGIMRSNICRYLSTLREQNKVAVIRKRKCSITSYPYAVEYTADNSLLRKSNQLTMF
jgi:hypothetical protein